MKKSTLERLGLEGKEVVILGGGGIAFDAAFTARRLGAAGVRMICLEAEGAMHAPEAEVAQARDEHIAMENSMLAAAVESDGEGGFTVAAVPVSGFSFDEKGALHVQEPVEERKRFFAHLVICASGLQADLTALSRAGRGTHAARLRRGGSRFPHEQHSRSFCRGGYCFRAGIADVGHRKRT